MSHLLPAWPLIDNIVDRALEEDLASGDLTTEACVPHDRRARASFVARSTLVASGLPVARRVFERLSAGEARADAQPKFVQRVADGDLVQAGSVMLEVEGPAWLLLTGERVALNFVQRTCGVATITRKYVQALGEGSRTRIVDTRKTTPGLRALERYAVRCGGGHNHRDMLGSAVLIKDNHLVAAGSVRAAIERARAFAPHTARIECEVETLEQLADALEAGADAVLLDNMDDATVEQAVALVRARAPKTWIEASGGITLPRLPVLARLGVDVISVGALTHSAPSADVALDLDLLPAG